MKAHTAAVAVFAGCSGNAVFLELLTRGDPGSGILITFAQFVFISLTGFIFTSKFGSVKRIIPIKNYILMVTMFAVVNGVNNFALKFDISMPLHMIFRSGTLITNMMLGKVLLKRQYTLEKYISVIMITIGITICTIESAEHSATSTTPTTGSFTTMTIGVFLLSLGLLLSSWLGIRQETLFLEYGKHPDEALYYSHLLPLPGFLLFYEDLWNHAKILTSSELFEIPILGMMLPEFWLYLLGNITTQYLCISSVYVLQTECTSLTTTLIVTLRKFFSLLVSIFYFSNPFTILHWVGSVLVFGGTIMFTGVLKSSSSTKKTN